MATDQTFAALAAQDAASAYARAAQLAKSPEQVLREFIAGQYAQAFRELQVLRGDRAWRRKLIAQDPRAAAFFGDKGKIILPLVASRRRSILTARARLTALLTMQKKAA